MDSDRYCLTIGLLPCEPLDVDDIFKTVDGCDFALATFVAPSYDLDFVVFANRYRSNLPAVSYFIPQVGFSRHQSCRHTPCLSRSSLFSGADMISLRLLDGALWWAARDLRRDEETTASMVRKSFNIDHISWSHTALYFCHGSGELLGQSASRQVRSRMMSNLWWRFVGSASASTGARLFLVADTGCQDRIVKVDFRPCSSASLDVQASCLCARPVVASNILVVTVIFDISTSV